MVERRVNELPDHYWTQSGVSDPCLFSQFRVRVALYPSVEFHQFIPPPFSLCPPYLMEAENLSNYSGLRMFKIRHGSHFSGRLRRYDLKFLNRTCHIWRVILKFFACGAQTDSYVFSVN